MGYIHCEVLDDITNLFPNVIDATAIVGEWIENNKTHTLLGMWFLNHDGINVNPCQ